MSLTNIEYGSLASSEILNSNFRSLKNDITELSENTTDDVATINSNIATLNNTISSLNSNTSSSISSINSSLTEINNKFNSNGLYITTYVNGNSWYREYFSDSEKTTRIWIEQGGTGQTGSTTTLLKTMSNTNYTIVLGRLAAYFEAEGIDIRYTNRFFVRNGKGYSYAFNYYICGI